MCGLFKLIALAIVLAIPVPGLQAIHRKYLSLIATPPPIIQRNDPPVCPSSNEERFQALKKQYPFADSPELIEKVKVLYTNHTEILGFGHRGRVLVEKEIMDLAKRQDSVVVMEVGVWFGQSLAKWLKVNPLVRVVGIEPFKAPSSEHYKLRNVPENLRQEFGQPAFNRALAECTISNEVPGASSRTVLLTGLYPEAADPLFQTCGIDVDVFYLDGGKSADPDSHLTFVRTTIEYILDKYPNVLVAGDDWNHGAHAAQFQSLLHDIAKKNAREIVVAGKRTWIMKLTPVTQGLNGTQVQ